jgi:hypothetical protein
MGVLEVGMQTVGATNGAPLTNCLSASRQFPVTNHGFGTTSAAVGAQHVSKC